jgi:hypothetical protein
VQLGQVKLEIEGTETRALCKVRLEHVRATLEEILEYQKGGIEGRTRGTLGEVPPAMRGRLPKKSRREERFARTARGVLRSSQHSERDRRCSSSLTGSCGGH